jgi:outer membrane beta-barrel protein
MIQLRRMSNIWLAVVAAGVLTCAFSRTARAQDDSDEVATYAVQKRLFREGLELNAAVSFMPLNAFFKSFAAGGSVTYHFTTTWGWEIAQAAYVFVQTDTGLENQLLQNFDVQPSELTSPQFLGSSNIIFTPFYGKLAGLNHSVSHIELFFPIGPAIGRYQNPGEWLYGLDLGVGIRWFLAEHVALRIEARDFLLTPGFSDFSLTQELLVALGLSVAFGGDER